MCYTAVGWLTSPPDRDQPTHECYFQQGSRRLAVGLLPGRPGFDPSPERGGEWWTKRHWDTFFTLYFRIPQSIIRKKIHAIKAYMASGGIAPLILNLERAKKSASLPRLFPSERKTHWVGVWVGPRGGLDILENRKIFCPCLNGKHGPQSKQISHHCDCVVVTQYRTHWRRSMLETESLHNTTKKMNQWSRILLGIRWFPKGFCWNRLGIRWFPAYSRSPQCSKELATYSQEPASCLPAEPDRRIPRPTTPFL